MRERERERKKVRGGGRMRELGGKKMKQNRKK